MTDPASQLEDHHGELAIEAQALSKCYRIYNHPRDRLRQSIWPRNIRGKRVKLFREMHDGARLTNAGAHMPMPMPMRMRMRMRMPMPMTRTSACTSQWP